MELPWFCDFGLDVKNPDWCGLEQSIDDRLDWTPGFNTTPTAGTGPPIEEADVHGENNTHPYYTQLPCCFS